MSRMTVRDGDSAITAEDGRIVFGPITKGEALAYARRVIAGEKHTITDPLMLGSLATAIAVFFDEREPEAAQEAPAPPVAPAEAVA